MNGEKLGVWCPLDGLRLTESSIRLFRSFASQVGVGVRAATVAE